LVRLATPHHPKTSRWFFHIFSLFRGPVGLFTVFLCVVWSSCLTLIRYL
jgi:hypothetical protein